jgi:hypothetical protein
MDEDPQLRAKYGALAKLADLHHEAGELTHNPFQRFQSPVSQKTAMITSTLNTRDSDDPLLGLLQEVQSAEARLNGLKQTTEPHACKSSNQ